MGIVVGRFCDGDENHRLSNASENYGPKKPEVPVSEIWI